MPNNSFMQKAVGAFVVELFGYVVEDLAIGAISNETSVQLTAGGLDPKTITLVNVVAVKGQTLCAALPHPLMLILPDKGTIITAEECDLKPDGKLSKWTVHKGLSSASIKIESATIEDLVIPALPLQPRGGSAGLQLTNPRIVNGQACITVHVWAKYEQCVHIPWDGDKCVTLLDVNETRDVCVTLSGCVPIFSVGPVSLNACFIAPNQLCVTADINVSFWSGTIARECVALPIPHAANETTCKCAG